MAAVEDKVPRFGGWRVSRSEGRAFLPCPFPSLTAYWTPPPSWPRRLLCESKLLPCTVGKSCWAFFFIILVSYFLVMDGVMFTRYKYTSLVDDAKIGHQGEIYSPFTHLSIKAILSDHVRHYIFTPTAEYFNSFTRFSSVFFVTPNMVSLAHLMCAFVAGKFIASENLYDRRIGVMLYFFRTWLDSLDGIVFRAHAGHYLQYNSVYSSFGYIVDALFDTLGGFFLSCGILFYLFKRFATSKHGDDLPVWMKSTDSLVDSPKMSNGHNGSVSGSPTMTGPRKETYSHLYLFLKTLSFGIALSVAGICWDRAVKSFTEVFQVELQDKQLAILQFNMSHCPTTMGIFFLWRFISGQTVLTYAQVAIYMDKTWEFLRYAQWVLLLITIPLYAVTVLYIQQIRSSLHL